MKTELAIADMTRAERLAYLAEKKERDLAKARAWRAANAETQREYRREQKQLADAARGKR